MPTIEETKAVTAEDVQQVRTAIAKHIVKTLVLKTVITVAVVSVLIIVANAVDSKIEAAD